MKSWRHKLLTKGRRKDRIQAERVRLRELNYNCTPEQWLSGEYPGNDDEETFEEFRREELIETLAEEREGERLFFAQERT
jgi:hypothetical protein